MGCKVYSPNSSLNAWGFVRFNAYQHVERLDYQAFKPSRHMQGDATAVLGAGEWSRFQELQDVVSARAKPSLVQCAFDTGTSYSPSVESKRCHGGFHISGPKAQRPRKHKDPTFWF